ncbi:strawberry notch-like NTP hydrolase domain-containing protein [Sphingomonas sp. 3-13AW]|uniref:strawberry notch-like NTP hydrolase domain-containing protein n=1 Tax=Sphingomonas sp. 3-13AW TaxID=3050450 RepID=UPI003BB60064
MNQPSKHLLAIRSGQKIEAVNVAERREAFREACRAMRKYLSPVLKPAGPWFARVDKLRLLCGLEADERIVVELLAARLVAQLDACAAPGPYVDLLEAAGLQIVSSGISLGDDETCQVRIVEGSPEPEEGCRVISIGEFSIVLSDASQPGRIDVADRLAAAAEIDSLAVRNSGGLANVELSYGPAPLQDVMLFDSVHDPWRASTIYSDKLKAHPNQVIEPAPLAATAYPEPTYRPLLPVAAIERGMISDVQFEAIVYGLQATEKYLGGAPSGNEWDKAPRGGFIVGDGTGVGKSNIAMGMVLDQWHRGRRRHVIVVERENHYRHIQEAWETLGGKPRDIVWHGHYEARGELPDRDAVIVTSYALIRNDDRYEALLSWARTRGEYHGFLIFDEAQNMRNAVEDEMHEGGKVRFGSNQSQQGMRGVEIQEALPDARVVYMSATMATDVFNLGYAARLGLWGHNAPFGSLKHFLEAMRGLDEAGLEQVSIDLKSAGRYCSRSLSFDGVEYEELEHAMTPVQRQSFDALVRGWQEVDKIMDEASRLCGGRRPREEIVRTKTMNQTMKRLAVEQALSGFVTESLVDSIHRDIAEGRAPVIQIAMTGAARLEQIANGRSYVPEEDFFEKGVLQRIDQLMNVHEVEYVQAVDAKTGKPKFDATGKPVLETAYLLDDNGKKIENQKALDLRNKVIALARDLSPRHGILDRLYEAFPASMIAEMTGRKYRALPHREKGQVVGWHIEERSPKDKDADVDAFLRGEKKILVFSLAAGGSGRSYHASSECANQMRRVHYIVELGRRADQAVQGIGRTHRSGQVVAPIVKIVRCDIPAHMIYASRTLEKLSKLGALSSGHQQAKTNAILEQRIPLRGRYAQLGWTRTLDDVIAGKLAPVTYGSLVKDLNLEVATTDRLTNKPLSEDEIQRRQTTAKSVIKQIEQVIEKIALLTDGDQRALIDTLARHTESEIAEAVRKGEYNQGLETIRASSIKVIDERRVVNPSGGATTYVRLRRQDDVKPITFMAASVKAANARRKRASSALFLRHRVSGRVMLAITGERSTGIVETFSPRGTETRSIEMLRHEPWKIIQDMFEAERLWDLEKERLDMKGVSDIHMLTGSLLYNWSKLPERNFGLQRCKTDDGRIIVGRVIHSTDLRKTLQDIGIQAGYKPIQISMMLSKVDQGAEIAIDNGWRIVGCTSGYRLLVPDEEQTGEQRAAMQRMGILVHDTPLGHELEIPRATAVAVVQQLSVGSELTVQGVANVQAAPQPANSALSASPLPLAA